MGGERARNGEDGAMRRGRWRVWLGVLAVVVGVGVGGPARGQGPA